MNLENLRANQLTPAAWAWYQQYLAAIDNSDVDAYVAHLAADATIQFNNDAPVAGRATIEAMLRQYWKSFRAVTHEPLNIYGTDNSFVLEALNHYTRHDGKTVTTRATAFTDRNPQGQVTAIRIYADTSPVFE